MKYYQFAILGGLFSCIEAIRVERSIPGVVALPFERRAAPRLYKRDGRAVNLQLGSLVFNNIINLTVGTPPQPITASLDTGSSDTILLHDKSTYCIQAKGFCPSLGYYNANKSSSYKYMSSGFEANFGFAEQGAGSNARGDIATDTIGLGGISLKEQQLALSYGDSSIAFSILGLGYASAENQVLNQNPKPPYDNLPLAMAKQGGTNLALFSMWKDTAQGHNGHLMFGGVDKDKYSGNLATLPVQARDNGITAYDVTLQGVQVKGDLGLDASVKGPFNVVLDCGSSGSILSDEMAQPIFDKFGVTYFEANNSAQVDCAVGRSATTIDFEFDGVTISAPIAAFVVRFGNDTFCSFGIVAAGKRRGLLGDNFLTSAYAVFDVSNNEISLGQRKWASTREDIVVVPKEGVKAVISPTGPSTVPTPEPTTTGTDPAAATTSKPGSASSLSWNGMVAFWLFASTCVILMV